MSWLPSSMLNICPNSSFYLTQASTIPIKVYGERNSGTNYLQQLLSANFDIELVNYLPPRWMHPFLKFEIQTDFLLHWDRSRSLGWKHGKPHTAAIANKIPTGLKVISITKNPYAFLVSLHRRPYHFQGTAATEFSDFIRQPWKTILRDHCQGVTYDNPMQLWNVKNRAYWELHHHWNGSVACITYENLLAQPEQTLASLSQSISLDNKRVENFIPIVTSTKETDKSYTDYLDYYGNQRWKETIPPEDIPYINSQLDPEVLSVFQYAFL